MKWMIGTVIGLFLILGCSTVHAETIGTVNIQKVNAVIPFKTVVKRRVVQATKEQGQMLPDMISKISKKEIELRKKTSELSADQKKAIEADIQTERQKFFAFQRTYQLKTATLFQKENKDIQNKVEQILGVIAKKHDLQKVFNESDVAYTSKKIDLTDELIEELKKIYGTRTGNEHEDD